MKRNKKKILKKKLRLEPYVLLERMDTSSIKIGQIWNNQKNPKLFHDPVVLLDHIDLDNLKIKKNVGNSNELLLDNRLNLYLSKKNINCFRPFVLLERLSPKVLNKYLNPSLGLNKEKINVNNVEFVTNIESEDKVINILKNNNDKLKSNKLNKISIKLKCNECYTVSKNNEETNQLKISDYEYEGVLDSSNQHFVSKYVKNNYNLIKNTALNQNTLTKFQENEYLSNMKEYSVQYKNSEELSFVSNIFYKTNFAVETQLREDYLNSNNKITLDLYIGQGTNVNKQKIFDSKNGFINKAKCNKGKGVKLNLPTIKSHRIFNINSLLLNNNFQIQNGKNIRIFSMYLKSLLCKKNVVKYYKKLAHASKNNNKILLWYKVCKTLLKNNKDSESKTINKTISLHLMDINMLENLLNFTLFKPQNYNKNWTQILSFLRICKSILYDLLIHSDKLSKIYISSLLLKKKFINENQILKVKFNFELNKYHEYNDNLITYLYREKFITDNIKYCLCNKLFINKEYLSITNERKLSESIQIFYSYCSKIIQIKNTLKKKLNIHTLTQKIIYERCIKNSLNKKFLYLQKSLSQMSICLKFENDSKYYFIKNNCLKTNFNFQDVKFSTLFKVQTPKLLSLQKLNGVINLEYIFLYIERKKKLNIIINSSYKDKEHNVYNFKCHYCNKNFRKRTHIINHLQVCHYFECNGCRRVFQNKSYLVKHIKCCIKRLMHRSNSYSSYVNNQLEKVEPNHFKTFDLCQQNSKSKKSLIKPVKISHDQKCRYICYICNEKFSQKSLLKKHMKLHFKSKIESSNDNDIDSLDLRFVNSKINVTHTSQCDFLTLNHKNINFNCDLCFKMYPNKGSLQKYITNADNFNFFKCNYYQNNIKLKCNLKRHIEGHFKNTLVDSDVSSRILNVSFNTLCYLCGELFPSHSLKSIHITNIQYKSYEEVQNSMLNGKNYYNLESHQCNFNNSKENEKYTDISNKNVNFNADFLDFIHVISQNNNNEIVKKKNVHAIDITTDLKKSVNEQIIDNEIIKKNILAITAISNCNSSFYEGIDKSNILNYYKCEKSSFQNTKVYVNHLSNTHINIGKLLNCSICKKNVKAKPKYKNKVDYNCDICGLKLTQKRLLKLHKMNHKNENNLVECKYCFKKMPAFKINKHEIVHKNSTKKLCTICGKFYSRIYFKKHLLTHDDSYRLICPHCGKKFVYHKSLQKHLLLFTLNKKCNFKIAKLNNKSYPKKVKNNLNCQEKKYQCKLCYTIFCEKKKFQEHNLLHGNHKMFDCNVCSKTFSKIFELKMHKLEHDGEHLYNCVECNKSFSRSSKFMIHMKIEHGGRVCEICNIEFNYMADFMMHQRVHKLGNKFVCELCDSGTFNFKMELKYHIKICHGESLNWFDV